MPRPRKKRDESWKSYINRLTKHYIEEGYPPKQAYAIANSIVNKMRNRK